MYRSHRMDACRTRETHKKIVMRRSAPNFCPYFGKVSEFTTNVQRTASALGRILSVSIAYKSNNPTN